MLEWKKEKNTQNFTLIGIGGVVQPKDYSMYIKAGADAVMSATGAMWNSSLAQEISNYKGKK